jgi:RNA polymerase sigma factor for flagellar operon FliA
MNMELAERYMPLAESMAHRRGYSLPRGLTLDDIKSAAYYALVEAASRYEPERGVSFPTYAKLRISGEITDCFRRVSTRPNPEPEREFENPFGHVDTKDFFEFACSELCEEDGKMVRMYYVDGRSLKEVGALRGVSESRASQILKKCHSRIRKSLSRKGYK